MTEAGMQGVRKRHRIGIVVHIYYPDIWREFEPFLSGLGRRFDLFLTIPHEVAIDEAAIRRSFPGVNIQRCENRGRDIAPFLTVFSGIARLGYDCICKLHTKSSPHLIDGRAWRVDMLRKLIGSPKTVSHIIRGFAENPNWGVIAPLGHVVPRELYWHANAANVRRLATGLGINGETSPFAFVAGSMFWFRPQALLPLGDMEIGTSDFEPETGAVDGTLAHAFERLFGLVPAQQGYRIAESDGLEIRPSEIPYHFRLLAQVLDSKMEEERSAATGSLAGFAGPPADATTAAPPPQASPPPPTVSIQELREVHLGQTAWIVGKGPSLINLSARHFGPGPVIALNEAVLAVEALGLQNPIYSMQKDADEYGFDTNHVVRVEGTSFVPLKSAALLVHKHESPNRMPNYAPRYVFDNVADFGLDWWDFSSLVSLAIARLMGCRRVVYVSHDACVFGESRTCNPRPDGTLVVEAVDEAYQHHRGRIDEYVASAGMTAEWLTPETLEAEERRAADGWVLAELEQRRRDVDELTRLMTEATARESELSGAVAKAQGEADRLSNELSDAQTRESQVQAELERSLDRARRDNAQIEGLIQDRTAVTGHMEAAKTELDGAKARINAGDARILNLTAEVAAVISHLKKVQTELDSSIARIAADDTRIQNLTADLAAGNSHLQSVQAELEDARNRIVADGARITNLTGKVAAAADRVHHVTAELEQSGGRIAADEARIDGLNSELAAVRQQLQTVLASRSWRWTTPLRRAHEMLTRTKQ